MHGANAGCVQIASGFDTHSFHEKRMMEDVKIQNENGSM